MNFLEDLGKEDVQLKKRRGKKLVVVDPEAATRYAAHRDRCDGESGRTHVDGVLSNSGTYRTIRAGPNEQHTTVSGIDRVLVSR